MEVLENIILTKTNEVFKKTVGQKNCKQQLTLLNTYFYWSEFIDTIFTSKKQVMQLLNESTLDIISSLFNTFSGFYRQGMISLRSSLELTVLFVYYFDHPVEFNYFLNESGYKGPLISSLINNEGFLTKRYCGIFIDSGKLKEELHSKVTETYKELSKYVHGRLGKLQSLTNMPINFNYGEFSKFMDKWKSTIGLGNTILAIRFWKEMDKMDKEKKDVIYSIIKELGVLEVKK